MNINRVALTGNLTRKPELRSTQTGTSVAGLRVASNARQKTKDEERVEKPNYFDITVFGGQAENCEKYLEKGRGVAVGSSNAVVNPFTAVVKKERDMEQTDTQK